MTTYAVLQGRANRKYEVKDAKCVGRYCFAAGVFIEPGGGAKRVCLRMSSEKGCPVSLPPTTKKLLKQRKQNHWTIVEE